MHERTELAMGPMIEQMESLFPICRSITGNGVRQTLKLIGEQIPIDVTEVPSGSKVFDWQVPPEWNIRDAYLQAPDGRKIVDFYKSNLHVVNYSHGIDQELPLLEIAKHLHSLPAQPELIPYRTTYYQRNWGFCLPHQELGRLVPGDYRVLIDADHDPKGSLTYGEFFLPGRQPDEVFFSCHICHPSLANDNLAAVVIATELAKFLASSPRRYSYRILFAPGCIGTLSWLHFNRLTQNRIVAGLVLALLADSSPITYKKTRRGSATIDHVVEQVLKDSSRDFNLRPFDPFGYDERQHGSAGIDLPIGRLSRAVEGGYPEYHTSADNLDFVSSDQLEGSLETLKAVVETLEADRAYINRRPHGEPQLGRRGLYPVTTSHNDPMLVQKAIMWNLSLSDGKTGISEISNRSGLQKEILNTAADILVEKGLFELSSGPDTPTDVEDQPTHGKPSLEAKARCQLAHELIPGGAHTYAKGDDQFPTNAPRFFSRGEGCYAYDSDGNRFIEYGMGLRAVGLGHAFPEVVEAAHKQMKLGANFTRPATIELEAAEALLKLLPAADMVKFAKNGSDATTAAIRLARAKTGRTKVLVCGDQPFFSVDDWFIGTTPMNAGIPGESVSPIVRFPYDDIDTLRALFEQHSGEISCLIMEACTYVEPSHGYLLEVQALCRENGALFILDEMITGFRFNVGGAQADFGLDPDLSTFGKAMGNGISVAALAGKREHMELGGLDHDKERVFLLSYTHGAETHCLAAAKATIQTYLREPVIETMYRRGFELKAGLESIARGLGVQEHFYTMGRGCNLIYITEDRDGNRSQGYRTLLLQELIKNGVFAPSLVVSYAHGEAEIEQTLVAFEKALAVYSLALENGYEKYLEGRPSKPVFRSRN